ncbi:helix-turn-helix domain-containing protein [Rhodococcus jostii]|uniref:helix-turn-helix domain-containing protein n=1 Tax=Rhodococcus jostii TaxID=132919 RepID=UPI003B82E29C
MAVLGHHHLDFFDVDHPLDFLLRGTRLFCHVVLSVWIRRSINEVAATWGFHPSGHFARHYRTRFGVSPSETRGVAGGH